MAALVVALVLGSAAIALLGFVSYLAFCAFVVVRTNGTSGLRDVAVAIRAFSSVGTLSGRSRLEPTLPPPRAELDQMVVPQPDLTGSVVVIPPPAISPEPLPAPAPTEGG